MGMEMGMEMGKGMGKGMGLLGSYNDIDVFAYS